MYLPMPSHKICSFERSFLDLLGSFGERGAKGISSSV